MGLREVIAAVYTQSGKETLSEQEIVVALSLRRDWFSPDQAKRVVTLATDDGFVMGDSNSLEPTFDPGSVSVPASFTPDEGILTRRSVFETILERLVDAGQDKRSSVAAINELQRDLDVSIDAAAAIFACSQSVDVTDEITRARRELNVRSGRNG